MTCISPPKRYYQQMVIMNRKDIRNKRVVRSYTTIGGEYVCRYGVYFDLLPGKTGYRFTVGETATQIFGTADKTEKENIVQYAHSCGGMVMGVTEQVKCILSQLDQADTFVALQFLDGTVEIFGFEYGMKTSNYSYDPANNGGATLFKLVSDPESLEDELPLVYLSQGGSVNDDFNNNFANHEFNLLGDFNYDFSTDFYNEGL